MTDEELEEWKEDLKAAQRLVVKFPTASIRNICQQVDAIITNEENRRLKK